MPGTSFTSCRSCSESSTTSTETAGAPISAKPRRADKRLKGLRDNGDVRTGARVAGDVFAVFEHKEPRSDGLPEWLELDVPDDRLVASALLLQSAHPGSRVVVATGDMNLQNKLAAVGLPFIQL